MQSQVPATPKDTLRAIRIFFYTLIAGMGMFSIIVFALNFWQAPQTIDKAEINIFLIAVVVIASGCILAAFTIYKKRIGEIQISGKSLSDKLEAYRVALVLFMALCEGGGIFAAIVYYKTANEWLLVIIGAVLLCMILKRPEKFRIFNELQLSAEEQSELN